LKASARALRGWSPAAEEAETIAACGDVVFLDQWNRFPSGYWFPSGVLVPELVPAAPEPVPEARVVARRQATLPGVAWPGARPRSGRWPHREGIRR
jgi:hypothetical protein